MIDELLLDTQLKWGMLLPISVAMVLVGLLRASLTVVFALKPKLHFFKKSREKYVVVYIEKGINWVLSILGLSYNVL